MILLGLLTGLLTIFFAGYGVTMLLGRPARLNALECSCASWLFGTGVVSVLLWILGIWITAPTLQIVVTGVCVALGLSGWRIAGRAGPRMKLPWPGNFIEWLLVCVIAAEIAMMFLMSFKYPLGWDGLLNWEIKARYAFLNGGTPPAAYYTDVSRAFSHPDYPLYLPLVELWLYLWMGEAHQFWIKIIFPTFYAVGVILLATTSTRLSGKNWVGGLAGGLFFFVPFLAAGYGGALHGYADFPVAVFYLGTMSYLLIYLQENSRNFLRLFVAILALLPWLKREGFVLWAVAALCGGIVMWRRKLPWHWFVGLGLGIVMMALWRTFLNLMHVQRSEDFLPFSVSILLGNWDRAPSILRGCLYEMTNMGRWSLTWALIALAFTYLLLRARDLRLLILSLAVFIPIFAYDATYFFSTWADYHAHIGTSLPRLLLQVIPVGWLVIALAIHSASHGAGDSRFRLAR